MYIHMYVIYLKLLLFSVRPGKSNGRRRRSRWRSKSVLCRQRRTYSLGLRPLEVIKFFLEVSLFFFCSLSGPGPGPHASLAWVVVKEKARDAALGPPLPQSDSVDRGSSLYSTVCT